MNRSAFNFYSGALITFGWKGPYAVDFWDIVYWSLLLWYKKLRELKESLCKSTFIKWNKKGGKKKHHEIVGLLTLYYVQKCFEDSRLENEAEEKKWFLSRLV